MSAPPPPSSTNRFAGLGSKFQRAYGAFLAPWFLRGVRREGRIYAFGRVVVRNAGDIRVGARVAFCRGPVATLLKADPGARLTIGDACVFNYGVQLEASDSIQIGHHCMFGSYVRVCDAEPHRRGPIVVEDQVWLAHGALILPGVRIGTGSVISAGSVIVGDVPPRSLAIGNPARCLSLSLHDSAAG